MASASYRYGFNGKENDNEVKGEGAQQDYGMRIYDPRVGRFLSVDPLTKHYPWYTPYQFAGNKPIWAIDLDGMEEYYSNTGAYLGHGKDAKNKELRMATNYTPLKDENGNILKDRYVIFDSKKITIKAPGKELKKLFADAQSAGGSQGKERGGFLVLDADNAVLYFRRHKQESSNTTNNTVDDPTTTFNGVRYVTGEINQVVIGQIHTHQSESFYIGKKVQLAPGGNPVTYTDQVSFSHQYSQPQGDGINAVSIRTNIFAIGVNVDFFSNKGRKYSINNITSQKSLFDGTFNILRFALEKYGKN